MYRLRFTKTRDRFKNDQEPINWFELIDKITYKLRWRDSGYNFHTELYNKTVKQRLPKDIREQPRGATNYFLGIHLLSCANGRGWFLEGKSP